MKPFNLEAAKNGAQIITRCGYPVRLICFDGVRDRPLIVLVMVDGKEQLSSYGFDGKYLDGIYPHNWDLIMDGEK